MSQHRDAEPVELSSEPVDLAVLAAELGGDLLTDPHPAFSALRSRGPVHRVQAPTVKGECWFVVGHEEARAALNDPRLHNDFRHSAEWEDDGLHSIGRNMLQVDPPDHTRLRRLVAREFTGNRVQSLRPRIQEITDGLVDAFAASGHIDLVSDLAQPLPVTVICELLGVPEADRDDFRTWSDGVVAPESPAAGAEAAQNMAVYFAGLIESKRQDGGDDLLSALVRTHRDDGGAGHGNSDGNSDSEEQLSAEELIGMAFLLLVAGHETTVGLISSGVRNLLAHPRQLAALRDDPALVDGAVEEMLRYDGPGLISAFRFPEEPVEIGGVRIPAGAPILIGLAATGRDAQRFSAPDEFDIHRSGGTRPGGGGHLTFGHGIHHCLGAPLARLEAATAVNTLLRRCPDLALDTDPAELTYREPGLLRALNRLPVRFTPPNTTVSPRGARYRAGE